MNYNNSYTLIIPTFNRPTLLRKLLAYLSNMQFHFQIMVLDSSSSATQPENKLLCADSKLSINYCAYPEETTPLDKWLDGLKKVTSEYVSFCADDDFVFPDAIIQSVDFLSENHDYIACHGNYINFDPDNHSNIYVEYCGSSIDGNSIIERIWQMMSNYEAINYATFRTEVLLESFVKTLEFETPMYVELLIGVSPLIRGKVKRLPNMYYARKSESGASGLHGTKGHPLIYFTHHTEEIFTEYAKYRNTLIKSITEHESGCDHVALIRHIDLIHSVYFMYSCDINHIIGLLNNELNISVPVFENTTVNCVLRMNLSVKQNSVNRYDMICTAKELYRYNLV